MTAAPRLLLCPPEPQLSLQSAQVMAPPTHRTLHQDTTVQEAMVGRMAVAMVGRMVVAMVGPMAEAMAGQWACTAADMALGEERETPRLSDKLRKEPERPFNPLSLLLEPFPQYQ